MLLANDFESRVPRASHGDTHVERLYALWKLSVQTGLSDAERIRAMLAMAARVWRALHRALCQRPAERVSGGHGAAG